MNQDAIKAGIDLLDHGGSSVDAALSVALSQVTALGGRAISFAGILNMLHYEAATGKIYNLNASFNTVQKETDPNTIPKVDYSLPYNDVPTNGRTVLVPGFMKGVSAAHARFGKLKFEKIFEHAIHLAETGTQWTAADSWAFSSSQNTLSKYPETKAIFTKEDGSFYKPGDVFKQPELAKTLRNVARKGANYMYTGPWAKNFVKAVRRAEGNITLKDMKDYAVIWSEPVHGTYHGYDIYIHGAPALSGAFLIEKLNLAESARLSDTGSYSENPETLYLLYLISTAQHNNYISFDSSIVTKQHAEKRWKQIAAEKGLRVNQQSDFKTDHSAAVVATDRWGNMTVILHTINTVQWGSNGLFVDGVSVPDPAVFQQYLLLATKTGNRLPDTTCPGLVFKGGKPILGFSCVGRGAINQSALALIKLLDYNMTPQQINDSPNIGGLDFNKGKANLHIEPQKFSEQILKKATELGGSFEEKNAVVGGFWSGVTRDYKSGAVHATRPLE